MFDCHGAGQRVSQQLFPGQDWRDSAETAQQMFRAYDVMRGLHDLIQEHGGRLDVDSTPGEGTTVTLEMPPR